jgi:hypothetical protein
VPEELPLTTEISAEASAAAVPARSRDGADNGTAQIEYPSASE